MKKNLEHEVEKIEKLLGGKSISRIMRPYSNDVCIEFTDGTKFFVTGPSHCDLDFSITGTRDE
jgi:hypothetical protein